MLNDRESLASNQVKYEKGREEGVLYAGME